MARLCLAFPKGTASLRMGTALPMALGLCYWRQTRVHAATYYTSNPMASAERVNLSTRPKWNMRSRAHPGSAFKTEMLEVTQGGLKWPLKGEPETNPQNV